MGSERPGTWKIASGEISSAASFSLAVLINSTNRRISSLFLSVVTSSSFQTARNIAFANLSMPLFLWRRKGSPPLRHSSVLHAPWQDLHPAISFGNHDDPAADRAPERASPSISIMRRRSVESERRREVPVSVDLRLQISDLLLRGGNGIDAGDKASRRWLRARNDDERSRELRRVVGLLAILGFPKLELLLSALVVVLDGRLGVVRRLLREELRAEEPWVDDGSGDAERRGLGVQRLHPAFQAELRRGVGGTELEADQAR